MFKNHELLSEDERREQMRMVNRELLEAIGQKSIDRVALCMSRGADIDVRREGDGRTPLMIAVYGEYVPLLKHLLDHCQPNPFLKDKEGKDIFDMARTSNDPDRRQKIITMLMEYLPACGRVDSAGQSTAEGAPEAAATSPAAEHAQASSSAAIDELQRIKSTRSLTLAQRPRRPGFSL